MEVAGLALTSIDLCFKYGSFLVQAFNTWKSSEREVAERITIFENAWMRTCDQVLFVQRIDHFLDGEHRRVLGDTLAILAAKLSLFTTKVESLQVTKSDAKYGFLDSAKKIKKGKYVLMKSTLDEVIRDMEDWQRRFDPSWYLILRIPDPMIDRALDQHIRKIATAATARTEIEDMESHGFGTSIRSTNVVSQSLSRQSPLINADGVRDALRPNPRHISIFLPEEDLDIVSIPYANAMLARRRGSTDTKWLIINSIQCTPSSNITAMTKDIRDLARKLTQVDPSRFGLLQCKGVIRLLRPPSSRLGPPSTPEIQSFDVVFRSPDGSSAFRCLREALLKPAKVSLSHRVRIAQQIAQSVNYVHALNFVHKNIRPESILIWDGTGSKFPSTFLVGFDNIRSADGATNLIGDTEWTTNIYRHPTRQGERLLESHKMQHDIYSLGVCLLEIGLWIPLIHYVQQDGAGLSLQKRCRRGTVLDDFVAGREETSSMLSGKPFKKYLVDLANAELPTLVGDRYTDIVINCLTCLDQENNGFGDESEMLDEDGILVGVRFIEAILLRLNEIVV